MKVPSFEKAMSDKDIFNYELSRNILGWNLSYVGENIAALLTKEQAFLLLEKMNAADIEMQVQD